MAVVASAAHRDRHEGAAAEPENAEEREEVPRGSCERAAILSGRARRQEWARERGALRGKGRGDWK